MGCYLRSCFYHRSLGIRSALDAFGGVGIVDYVGDSMAQPHAAGNRGTHHQPSDRRGGPIKKDIGDTSMALLHVASGRFRSAEEGVALYTSFVRP